MVIFDRAGVTPRGYIYKQPNRNTQDAARRLDGFYRLCIALSSDFASMLMMDAMTGTGLISEKEACERLFEHKSYKEWSGKHGKALKKRIAL